MLNGWIGNSVRAALTTVAVVAALGCGGAVRDPGAGDASRPAADAEVGPAEEPREPLDAGDGRYYGEWPTCSPDASPWASDECPMATSCQAGVCCNGFVVKGKCVCGLGPGCDALHVCCYTEHRPPAGTEPSCIHIDRRCY